MKGFSRSVMQIIYADSVIQLWPLAMLILCVVLLVQWRREQKPRRLFYMTGFGLYCLGLIEVTIFPIHLLDGDVYLSGDQFMRAVNLIPLNFDFTFIPHIVLRQMLLNIVLTVPFGLGANLIWQIKPRDNVLLAVCVGIGIELTQLIISLLMGYAYRIIDVNDAILNAIGVLIGYGIHKLIHASIDRLNVDE